MSVAQTSPELPTMCPKRMARSHVPEAMSSNGESASPAAKATQSDD